MYVNMPTRMHTYVHVHTCTVTSECFCTGQDADELAAQSTAVPGGIVGLDEVREPPLPALHNIPSPMQLVPSRCNLSPVPLSRMLPFLVSLSPTYTRVPHPP